MTVRLFDDFRTSANRALQIWLILISKASNRQTLTYGDLADMLGYRGAGTLANILDHIMRFCLNNGLPPLTVIVVSQDTGLPGVGLIEADLNADREAVYKYDWFAMFPPTPEELRAARQGQTK